ncbi:MAG: DUF2797 domain-containing protein [Oceanospirillales bacterium]|uniref:Uncharacterized protein DUF2797 n=1 Tax=Marinobacterium halophilum TaxID=267374 RepID=A0A2P8EUV4_9GAMM|nr:DUF2797 domain-containing protein [Marinobacterium halophilum]MBR9829992.1 DUF2797 domain-containing protein [Oceanospirillales bacterium]PSL13228.1 uncharacterized protein DUF2797 [Marinobacterium halophilum]
MTDTINSGLSGHLRKMHTRLDTPVSYQLPLGDTLVDLNDHIGQPITLTFTGVINCLHCGRKTKKSFSQGFCYPCFTRLPQCDSCIVKPEKCHFHEGTCRDPAWGERHCFQPHVVYLANSSGIKVGITRGEQVPTRWMDQGAIQALPILEVDNRLHSGLIEQIIAAHVSDKTNWRTMLKGQVEPLDLLQERDRLLDLCALQLDALRQQYGEDAIRRLDADVVDIEYPVLEYPSKIATHNFDKNPDVSGVLMGIKGQYLILDTGVINIRKFAAYHVQLSF